MKQAQTAAAVYHTDIVPTLEARQRFVRGYLKDYLETYRSAPTGLELVQFIQRKCPHVLIDVNTVRPRMTEMEAVGWVKHGEKRRCTISAKKVFTWQLSTPRPASTQPEAQQLPL